MGVTTQRRVGRGVLRVRGVVVPVAVAIAMVTGGTIGGVVATPDRVDWSAQSLAGTWGFSAVGTIAPPAVPAPVPAAAVGTMEFDGSGSCRVADTINVGGSASSRESTSCHYSVTADGRGSLTADFPDEPAPVPLAFVLVRRGSEFRFIRADAVVASGVADRQ